MKGCDKLDNKYISKTLYLSVEISQMLKNHECTYSEVEEILALLTDEFKEQRNELEYATYDDYFSGYKTNHVDNDVVMALSHVDGFC